MKKQNELGKESTECEREWMIKVRKWEKKGVKQWGKSERMKERIKKEHNFFYHKILREWGKKQKNDQ